MLTASPNENTVRVMTGIGLAIFSLIMVLSLIYFFVAPVVALIGIIVAFVFIFCWSGFALLLARELS